MITLPLTTNWNVCTPILFRFLDNEYVEQFFKDGSIRISSFSQFRKHEDEQRLDKKEGKTKFVHLTNQGGGQTIEAWATHGINAYVLCTTMRHGKELMDAFSCDSYFRINNSTNFGMALARHIPELVASYEGPCLYQKRKIIMRDLGYIDINKLRVSGNPEKSDGDLLNEFVVSNMAHYPLFLKDRGFAHQVEYRFLWIVGNKEADYLNIKAPEAVQFCDKPNSLME